MIQALVNMVIGSLGRGILAFYFAHWSIINALFLVWAGIMTYASIQLNKIRHMTVLMAVETLKNNPQQSDEEIWAAFCPKWQEAVEKINPRLILSRRNLWVTKPTNEKLIEMLRLSPDWFAAIRRGEVLGYRFNYSGKNDKLSSFLN
jgi:hypothetical protein